MRKRTAGDLKDTIRIQRRLPSDDGYGNSVADWVDIMVPRAAELLPTQGGEQTVADRLQGMARFDGVVRWDPETATITADDRVVDAQNPKRTFNVKFAQDMDGKRAWMFLQLEMGGSDG